MAGTCHHQVLAHPEVCLADFSNNRIRVVSTNGIITKFAGIGTAGYSGDGGPATNAELNGPQGAATSSTGEVYIADSSNNVIRVVATNVTITTFAGTYPVGGFSGDGGPTTSAELSLPQRFKISPSGEVYIADSGNNVIRIVVNSSSSECSYHAACSSPGVG